MFAGKYLTDSDVHNQQLKEAIVNSVVTAAQEKLSYFHAKKGNSSVAASAAVIVNNASTITLNNKKSLIIGCTANAGINSYFGVNKRKWSDDICATGTYNASTITPKNRKLTNNGTVIMRFCATITPTSSSNVHFLPLVQKQVVTIRILN